MKHIIFKSFAIAAALLATAVNAGAQYNIDGGVGTSKTVTGPDTDGNYTIRLETFATGTTTVTETYLPADIALVLDLSTSMNVNRGTTTRVTARTALSYNTVLNARTIGTNYLYYGSGTGYGSNGYYQLFGEEYNGRYYLYYNQTGGSNNHRYLRVQGNNITVTTTRSEATYATSADAAIITFPGGNNSNLYTGSSRIFALKEAVCTFIDTINEKDIKEDGTRIGHKLSIISFESDVIVHQDLESLGNINLDELKSKVWAFSLRTGTQPSEGIDEANTQLSTKGHSGTVGTDFSRVVVVFTDGDPYETPKYTAINSAYESKQTYKASVYTVGMFSSSPASGSSLWNFMNYMSSNYPEATLTGTTGDGTMHGGDGSDKGFYKDASSASVDLSAIFKAIAEGAGGAAATIGTSTQVRDVVTNSFVLPSTVAAADVHVYTSAATGSASGADDEDPAGWANPVEVTSSVGVSIVNVDANGNPTQNADEVKNKALFVTGFDYSKDDTTEGQGDGNWVGPRYKNGEWTWAGKKLIITFKVKADPEATGGESLTNTGKSGVYVQGEDGKYTCVNYYEQPHKTLTVNIKIRKTGLRHGESATFELMRIRPKNWDETKTLEENKANIEYNIIGKPIPGTHPYSGTAQQPDQSDYYEGMGWEGFKKVILTNKGNDGAVVEKDVLVLDPYWVYMVLEDDWGWAYTMTGDTQQVGDDGTYTTSSVEVNPFKFHNTEEADAVKHAEAIMINHFKGSESASKVEHEKSSKVEHF